MSYPPSSPRNVTKAGLAFGIATVLLWSVYNVGLKVAYQDGLRVYDMVFLRFFGGSIVLLPIFLLTTQKLPPLRHLLILFLMVGPLYSFLIASGFNHAPLGHALVVPPSVSMISANVFARIFGRERLSARRLIGMSFLIAGLIAIGSEASDGENGETSPVIGNLFFAASGTLWGGYTYLMSRWKLAPVPTTTGIALLSAFVFTPFYLMSPGIPDVPVSVWLEQFIYQGALGGALAFVAFAATIRTLGTGRAGLFFTLVPPTALVIAIPMVGTFPTLVQLCAIALAAIGIVISLELRTGKQG